MRLIFTLFIILSSIPSAGAQTVLLENFTLTRCPVAPNTHQLIRNIADKNKNVLALSCYTTNLNNTDNRVTEKCIERQAQYTFHKELYFTQNPMIILNGIYTTSGYYPKIIESGAAMTQIEDPAIPLDLRYENNALFVELPAQNIMSPMNIWLMAYDYKGAIAAEPLHNHSHPHYIPPKAEPKENIITAIKELGQWNGASETLTVPLSSFKADGYVILIQEKNYNTIKALGHYKSKSTQSGM